MSTSENIVRQRELYGEPLGDLVRRTTTGLGLSQAAMAKVVGLSPAMLSHLATGQRVKVANPVHLTRLQALVELAAQAPDLTTTQVQQRLAEIADLTVDLTTTQRVAVPEDGPYAVRRALQAMASGRELAAAIAALDGVAPGVAEFLRVYGTGTDDQLRAHFDALP